MVKWMNNFYLQRNRILDLFIDFPIIKMDKYLLRDIKENNYSDVIKIYNNKEIYKYNNIPHIRKRIDAIRFIKQLKYEYELEERVTWGIEDRENKNIIGIIGISDISIPDRKVEISYIIKKECMRKGIMKECIKVLLGELFSKYSLKRVEANIYIKNISSINLCKSLGFEEEGLRKKYIYNINTREYMDTYIYAIVN